MLKKMIESEGLSDSEDDDYNNFFNNYDIAVDISVVQISRIKIHNY